MGLTAFKAFRIAALLGFFGVALGAFGAHALEKTLTAKALAAWQTAVSYHLLHATVMLGLSIVRPFPAGAWGMFAAGVALFSGSLYAWTLGGPHWLVFVTPLGGVCLLAGWLWLAWRGIDEGLSKTTDVDPF